MELKHNKKKILLILVLAIIYLFIVINIHKIRFMFSMLDVYRNSIKVEMVAANEENINNPLDQILNPNINDSVNEPNKDIPDNRETDIKENDSENPNTKNNNNISKNPNNNQVEVQDDLYKVIVRDYNNKLINLHTKLEQDLDKLIDKGIEELKAGSKTKQQLFLEYISEGAELEKSSDKEFESIILLMETDLLANHFDTSIISEIEDYYSNIKLTKKQDIINRGIRYLE